MKIKSFMRLKLSERLQRALDDLKAVEKDPNFKVDMGYWCRNSNSEIDDEHSETSTTVKKYCVVCHAGSVLAKSINGPLFKRLMESTNNYLLNYGQLEELGEDHEVVEKFESFLSGVNELRENELEVAGEDFKLPADFFDKFKHKDKHVAYEDDPKGYKKWFQLVINYVAKQGK